MSTNCCSNAVMNPPLFDRSSALAQTFYSGPSSVPTATEVPVTQGSMKYTPIYNDTSCWTMGGCCGGWGCGGYAPLFMGTQTFAAKDSVGAIQTWNNDLSWGDMFNGVGKQAVANATSQLLTKDNIVGIAQGLLGVLGNGAQSLGNALG